MASRVFLPLAAACLLFWTAVALAAPSAEQRTQLRNVEVAIKKAGNLFKSKKYEEAGKAIDAGREELSKLYESKNAQELLKDAAPLHKQLVKAHEMLGKQGIELTPIPPAPAVEKAVGKAPDKTAAGQISFVKQVAPLLVAKCGRCHVSETKGEFSMATFEALKKGNKDGVVFFPGSSQGSRIVEVIEDGSMPKGGGKVSAEELTMLKAWIDQGAKFDGPNPAASLNTFGGGNNMPAQPKIEVAMASKNDAVQFARDIGPVLLENCMGCHGERQPRARLSFVNFTRLLQGGESGQIIVPGKGAESLLVRKLRGMEGERMPQGKPALADDVIAKIEQWINLGAKFDGPDPAMTLADAVNMAYARGASHEDLTRKRAQLAEVTWRTTIPDAKPDHFESKDFLFLGNVGEASLAEFGKTAEEQLPKLEKIFKFSPNDPLLKGRMTFFVFDKKYDYGEIGTMVEKREIPAEWKGHWRYTVVDAYGAVLPAKHDEYGLAPLLAQQMAGVYVASCGSVPGWFSEGSARAAAARIDSKDARVRRWDESLPEILGSVDKPEELFNGGLPPEQAAVASYSFVKSLMSNSARYQSVLTALKQGVSFDAAFAKAYGGPPAQVAAGWIHKAASKRGR